MLAGFSVRLWRKIQFQRDHLEWAKREFNPALVLDRQLLITSLQNIDEGGMSQADGGFNRRVGPVSMRLVQPQDDRIRILGLFQSRQLHRISVKPEQRGLDLSVRQRGEPERSMPWRVQLGQVTHFRIGWRSR